MNESNPVSTPDPDSIFYLGRLQRRLDYLRARIRDGLERSPDAAGSEIAALAWAIRKLGGNPDVRTQRHEW